MEKIEKQNHKDKRETPTEVVKDLLFDIYGLYIHKAQGADTSTDSADLQRDLKKVNQQRAQEYVKLVTEVAGQHSDNYPYVNLQIMTKDLQDRIDPKHKH